MIVLSNLFLLIIYLLNLFCWALILFAVISTLISFSVLDTRNRFVWLVSDFLYKITEPVVRPVRNVMPNLGAIDISPLIVLLLVKFVAIPIVLQIELYSGVPVY